jgi:hypothetical protein
MAGQFTLPEHCLLCFENATTDFLIPIPDSLPSPFDKRLVEPLAMALIACKNTAAGIEKLKQIVCDAMNSPEPDHAEEMVEEYGSAPQVHPGTTSLQAGLLSESRTGFFSREPVNQENERTANPGSASGLKRKAPEPCTEQSNLSDEEVNEHKVKKRRQ